MQSDQPTPVPPKPKIARITAALPFWIALVLVPLVWLAGVRGGWWILLPLLTAWYLFAMLDAVLGQNTENADPNTEDRHLFWYTAVTVIWAPIQFVTLFGLIALVAPSEVLGTWEKLGIFVGVGVTNGVVGINFAHELMHQKAKLERRMADILLAMVLYGHFRSEHLLVHHTHVGTPRDPVTARYNEGFHRFYPRVLRQCWHSAFRAEKARLERVGKRWHDASNPFWQYWALQGAMLFLAVLLGGWAGLGLFLVQAGVAVFHLELVNYIEHYGLTRKYLGNGRYEHVQPRHSWNAAQRASNWLLINLQRHSDHHYKPNRRFALLQTYDRMDAPPMPYGYPVMTLMALLPPVWRRVMNPRVQQWRAMYYPEITDWRPYNRLTQPPS